MEKFHEILEQLKGDDGLLAHFKQDPMAAVKNLAGELPTEELEKMVEGVKSKINLDEAGDVVEGVVDKIKDIFHKD